MTFSRYAKHAMNMRFKSHELGSDARPQHVRMQPLKLRHDDTDVVGARRRL